MTRPDRYASRRPKPPWLAVWLLERSLPGDTAEFALGDLEEDFHAIVSSRGRPAARRWFWAHTARVLLRRPRPTSTGRMNAALPDRPSPTRHPGEQMTNMFRDIRMALRSLRAHPVASATAVLTMALGVGANAAIFSVAWPVLVSSLPLPEEDRLAIVLLSAESGETPRPNPISPGHYFDLKRARSFESLAGFARAPAERTLTGVGEPQQLTVASVTGEFFDVLGVEPVLGRALGDADGVPGVASLVLHERTWWTHFGADPAVVGQIAILDGTAWTIVGVMPDAATIGTVAPDAWAIQRLDPATARQTQSYFLVMVGRLRPDVALDDANAEIRTIMREIAPAYPQTNQLSARAQSLRERLTGPVQPVFLLLLGGAALVLLVAGINLAGLHTSRNLARSHELVVRRALGAGRARIVRQLTTESLVLATLGGIAGLAAASMTLRVLATVAPAIAWYEISPQLTLPVVLYTGAITLAAGLAVGLGPAVVSAARPHTMPTATRSGTSSRTTSRRRTTVLAAQVALTVVLLIAATLSGASLVRVLQVDPGFELDGGLIADVKARGATNDPVGFFHQLVERAEAMAGAERACAISEVPLDTSGGWMTYVAEGADDSDRTQAVPLGATEGCFDVLRVPIVAGRSFVRNEDESVAIVSQSVARALWPGEADVVDRRVHIGTLEGPLFRVVGVAADIRADSLETQGLGQVWTSASRGWPMPERLVVRTQAPPETLAGPLRAVLQELNPDLALANVRTMDSIVSSVTASRRFVLVLLGGFAVIALALCAVGIYGVLSHQVGQRTREIGIRVALGAQSNHVLRVVVWNALKGVVMGALVGSAAAWALSEVLAAQLFEMSATDVRVYAAVTAFVLIVAALAAWSPIRRASRIDPLHALRVE